MRGRPSGLRKSFKKVSFRTGRYRQSRIQLANPSSLRVVIHRKLCVCVGISTAYRPIFRLTSWWCAARWARNVTSTLSRPLSNSLCRWTPTSLRSVAITGHCTLYFLLSSPVPLVFSVLSCFCASMLFFGDSTVQKILFVMCTLSAGGLNLGFQLHEARLTFTLVNSMASSWLRPFTQHVSQ